WYDALCVNQTDVFEKDVQVPRMGCIYKSANGVIVWLGDSSADSRLALSIMDYESTAFPYDQQIWRVIDNLLRRPWFERLWV
ncbi:heterokaryon incompatibility, partial [Hyaloscypha sp. PMI_1271]